MTGVNPANSKMRPLPACRLRRDLILPSFCAIILTVSASINYLGEVMVHKPSEKVGPIVNVANPVKSPSPEITLKTDDGQLIKGKPCDFQLASKEQYLSFVDGWL